MSNPEINYKAFNFTPHFWWASFDRGIPYADAFGAELIPNFQFKKWLREGTIEHFSISIDSEPDARMDKKYAETVGNDYYNEVIGKLLSKTNFIC
ncbi:MAG: hypothetical protein QM763_10480 [Agriterribacter sp.]